MLRSQCICGYVCVCVSVFVALTLQANRKAKKDEKLLHIEIKYMTGTHIKRTLEEIWIWNKKPHPWHNCISSMQWQCPCSNVDAERKPFQNANIRSIQIKRLWFRVFHLFDELASNTTCEWSMEHTYIRRTVELGSLFYGIRWSMGEKIEEGKKSKQTLVRAYSSPLSALFVIFEIHVIECNRKFQVSRDGRQNREQREQKYHCY